MEMSYLLIEHVWEVEMFCSCFFLILEFWNLHVELVFQEIPDAQLQTAYE